MTVQPIEGKKVVYLVQATNAAKGAKALLPGFQTEGTWTREHEALDEQTKSGRILGYGAKTEMFELTLYSAPGDAGQEAIANAYDNEEQVKVWRVELQQNTDGSYPARFGYSIIQSVAISDADSFAELTVTLPVIGKTQPGTLTDIPEELINLALYGFENPGEKTGELGEEAVKE